MCILPIFTASMDCSRIMFVDDEVNVLEGFKRLMRKERYDIATTTSPEEALQLLSKDSYALVLSDQRMPIMDGISFLEKVKDFSPDTIRILVTGNADTNTAIKAINRGSVYRFLTKPCDENELLSIVKQAVGYFETLMENRRLQELTKKQNTELIELNKNLAQSREQEVNIGSKIQQTLLMGQPLEDIKGAKMSAFSVPSQGIDGDFYDFFKQNDHCFDLIVGDVMGKGVPAALLGAAVKSQFLRAISKLISTYQGKKLPEPEEIVSLVHHWITDSLIKLENFFTSCFIRFDLEKNRFSFVNCGHTRTIHFIARTQKCKLLQGENMPIGFNKMETFKQASFPLEPGDIICIYSDGVTEARNDSKEFFGETRLTNLICSNHHLAPNALLERIKTSVMEFTGSKFFADDLTCVAVKIEANDSDAPISSREIDIPGDFHNLAKVREFMKSFCGEIDSQLIDEDDIQKIIIAVNEAVVNIIKHACKRQAKNRIQIELKLFHNKIAIRLYHAGEPFDPDIVPAPSFDGSKDSGYGIFIIHQCVDEISYSCDKKGKTCVLMIKKLKGGKKNDV